MRAPLLIQRKSSTIAMKGGEKLKAAAVLEKVKAQREEGEKAQILRELSALLLTIPATRKTTRSYIEKAIHFIQKK
jgi:hypothetical protein